MSEQAIATPAKETAVSLVSTKVPAHVSKAAGLGNENVTTDHIQVPRIKLLQQMNNEVDESHDAYVTGAKPGALLNTVTNELFKEIYVINVHFTEDFVIWRKREKGGGLVGTVGTAQEATEKIATLDGSPEDYEVIQTQSHLLLRKNEKTGALDVSPFLMDFASSKLRVSREWNTQIQQLGGDRFSSMWKITSVSTQNRAAQKFHNLSVENQGWVHDEDYEKAKAIYEGVTNSSK
jgi:hypothetical protein|tara:strand:+ start:8049 stop:8753 length:705 start_codon:yes stop_codon:yes gene_type:complete